jgi:hypothetical protein
LPLPALKNQFQRELNLSRVASGAADLTESRTSHDIGRKPEIYDVEQIEKFRPKLKIAKFAATPRSERRVFDQGKIEVVERWSAKRVPS